MVRGQVARPGGKEPGRGRERRLAAVIGRLAVAVIHRFPSP
ncbi:hypothetical protein [Micromonospora sp. NPDC002717]